MKKGERNVVGDGSGEGWLLRGDRSRDKADGSGYVLPEMTTVEHLTELRYRIVVAGAAFVGCSVVGWLLVPRVLSVFVELAGPLVFVGPAEAFFSHLKIAVTVGLLLSSPVIIWQAWKFVLPALFPHERALVSRMGPAAMGLACTGLLFGYFAIVPIVLQFLLGFGTERLVPTLSIGRFLSFFLGVTLPFALVFQVPLVILLLLHLRFVTLQRLREVRKFVIFGAFILGALLTPPDVASQILMAVPIIVLYEAALLIAARDERLKARNEAYSEG